MGIAGTLGSSADMSAVRQAIEILDGGGGAPSSPASASSLAGIDTPQGRLTLTSGAPVMLASVSNATRIYYTPYTGMMAPIYNGSNFVMTDMLSELYNDTTDAVTNPGPTVASTNYDYFLWVNSSGVPLLTRGLGWSGTTRITPLASVRGILTNGAAIPNGPAVNRGTYVGTVTTTSGNTLWMLFGTAASTGGTSYLNVYNYYNRVTISTRVTDTQAPYVYPTAVVRTAGGGGNMAIIYVVGVAEDAPTFTYQQNVATAASLASTAQVSIGDDTATFELAGTRLVAQTAAAATGTLNTVYVKGTPELTIGQHLALALELGDGTNCTFNVGQGGELTGTFRM